MRAWRWPARLAIVAAIAAAIVVDAQFGADGQPDAVVASQTTFVAGGHPLPGAGQDALTTTWYCPTIRAGSADSNLLATADLWVTNLQTDSAEVTITLLSATDRPVTISQTVDARSSVMVEIDDQIIADRVSAIVEAERGNVYVTRQMSSSFGVDDAQCSPAASTEWLFAAGDTQRDATEIVQVFNPFPDDVVLDVTFASEEEAGQYTAAELQTIVVPARQAVGVSIGEFVRRRDVVSMVLVSRGGGVVADRLQYYDGSEDRRGFGASLGISAAATNWVEPGLVVDDTTSAVLHIHNPNPIAAEIDVAAFAAIAFAGGDPIALSVPAFDTLLVPVVAAGSDIEGVRIEVDPNVELSVVVESANSVGLVVDVEIVVDEIPIPAPPPTTTTTTTSTTTSTTQAPDSTDDGEDEESDTGASDGSTTTTSTSTTTTTTSTTTTTTTAPAEIEPPAIVREFRANTGRAFSPLVSRTSTSWLVVGSTDSEVVSSAHIHNSSAEPVDVVVGRLDGTAVETLTVEPGVSVRRLLPVAGNVLLLDSSGPIVVMVSSERVGGHGVSLAPALPLV